MNTEAAAAILNVTLGDSRKIIDVAYRRRVRTTHPDVFAGAPPAVIDAATAEFRRDVTRERRKMKYLGSPRPKEELQPATPHGPANRPNDGHTRDERNPTAPPTPGPSPRPPRASAPPGTPRPGSIIDLAVFLHLLGRPESQRRSTGVFLTDAEAERVRLGPSAARIH